MASAPHNTASTHRSVVVRGTHEFLIVGYSECKPFARRTTDTVNYVNPRFRAPRYGIIYGNARCTDRSIKSGIFQVSKHTWEPVCTFGDQGHLTSVTLELLSTEIAKEVTVMASLQIDDPRGQWPPAVWRSEAANRFSRNFSDVVWKLPLPDAFCEHEERYVSDDDCLTILCTVDILQEDKTVAETRKCLVSVVPAPTIPWDFQQLLLRLTKIPKSSEVTFVVEDTKFRAHRLVLAMRSPVFAAELFGHMRESTTQHVRIEDVRASTFRAMLHFIYTDELPIKPNNDVESASSHNNFKKEFMAKGREAMVHNLLVAADRYDLERLRLMCENILCESIGVATVMTTLLLVRGRQRCCLLEDSCIGYISSDPDVYEAVRATKEYEELRETCSSFVIEVNERVATHNMACQTRSPSSSSNIRSPTPEKSTSMYKSEVVHGKHEFKIPNFSSVQRSHGVGQVIASDIFKVGGYDWTVNVYPSGYSAEGGGEHISVYLRLWTDPGTASVKLSKRFRIDDPNGKSPSIELGSEDIFTKVRETWGFQKFIMLNSAKSRYIRHNGSLTIHCDLEVHTKACTTSTRTTIAKPMIVVPPSNVVRHLEQLMVSKQWSDLTLLLEENEIHAHWLIIAVRSPLLYETLVSLTTNSVIRFDDVKTVVLKAVLHFVYTDEVLPVDDTVVAVEMLAMACRFRLERMKAMCENLLAHLMSKDNALSTLELALQHNCEELKIYGNDFISRAMK